MIRRTRRAARATSALALLVVCASTVPAAIAQQTTRVAVISDLNGSYGSTTYESPVTAAVRRVIELRPDLVISTGDMVAGQRLHPPLSEDVVQNMWSAFHLRISEPIGAAGIPLVVTPGNHDASGYPAFARERAVFAVQWRARMPAVEFVDRGNYPFDYAFTVNDVMFVALDVTRVGPLEPSQRDWVDDILQRFGPRHRHRIVFSHLPIHPFTEERTADVSGDRRLEEVLRRHQVDLYLSGHHHAFFPGYLRGIRYVSQACLGASPRRLLGTENPSSRAVTWIELDEDEVRIGAWTGPEMRERIALETLPRSISGAGGTMVRDDLRPRNVTARSSPEAVRAGAPQWPR